MEIALDESIPSYGGGLGIALPAICFASTADIELPMVGDYVSLLATDIFDSISMEADTATEESDSGVPRPTLQAAPGNCHRQD